MSCRVYSSKRITSMSAAVDVGRNAISIEEKQHRMSYRIPFKFCGALGLGFGYADAIMLLSSNVSGLQNMLRLVMSLHLPRRGATNSPAANGPPAKSPPPSVKSPPQRMSVGHIIAHMHICQLHSYLSLSSISVRHSSVRCAMFAIDHDEPTGPRNASSSLSLSKPANRALLSESLSD